MKVLNTSTVTVSFKNAFLDNLDWNLPEEILEDACGVILGGSGEFDFDGGRELFDEKKTASHALVISMQPFLSILEHAISLHLPYVLDTKSLPSH